MCSMTPLLLVTSLSMLMAALGMSACTALKLNRKIRRIRVGRGQLEVAENQLRIFYNGFMVSETFVDDMREYFLLWCCYLILPTWWEYFCFLQTPKIHESLYSTCTYLFKLPWTFFIFIYFTSHLVFQSKRTHLPKV